MIEGVLYLALVDKKEKLLFDVALDQEVLSYRLMAFAALESFRILEIPKKDNTNFEEFGNTVFSFYEFSENLDLLIGHVKSFNNQKRVLRELGEVLNKENAPFKNFKVARSGIVSILMLVESCKNILFK